MIYRSKKCAKRSLLLRSSSGKQPTFCSALPITIGFSANVGRILREFDCNGDYSQESGHGFYV